MPKTEKDAGYLRPFGADIDPEADWNGDDYDPDETVVAAMEKVEITFWFKNWQGSGSQRTDSVENYYIALQVFCEDLWVCTVNLAEFLPRALDLCDDDPKDKIEALEELQTAVAAMIAEQTALMDEGE